MADTDTIEDIPDLASPLARDIDAFEPMGPETTMPVPYGGQAVIMAAPREVTAKKVAVPRDIRKILAELKIYCASFGDTYVYSWEVNDRKSGRKQTIEGGTIKLANDLAQLFGNCSIDVDIQETDTHWLFKAWFVDYERGTSVARIFQQRKSQDIGKKYDAERARDMVFQVGQSKAIRNITLNALSSLTHFAIEESKKNLLEKFADPENRKNAVAFIQRVMKEHAIDLLRVEAVVGRNEKDWTVRDLAKVYLEMRGIHDGLTNADDIYPSDGDAGKILDIKQQESAEGRKPKGKDKPAANGGDPGDLPDSLKRTKPGAEPKKDTPPSATREPTQEEETDIFGGGA